MAYTAVPIYATGTMIGATIWETYIADNMAYFKAALDNYVHIEEQQTSGTDGGTFTSGAWQTRVLNTEVADPGGLATLASNQITLAAGTYRVHIACPAYKVGVHQARLQNISDGTTLLLGGNAAAGAADNGYTHAMIQGVFTIASSKVLEVQHRGTTTASTTGFGLATSWGTEVYTTVELIRIGD